MDLLLDTFGDLRLLALAGGSIGLLFGYAAQRSRFCLRAATVELSRGQFGPRIAIWFLAFSAALVLTQTAVVLGWLDLANARQLTGSGSLSGAIIGGLLFGFGMILARGCASRLLVLSATGNLRALVTGLILTVTAQASISGILAGPREHLAAIWLIGEDGRDLLRVLHVPEPLALAAGVFAFLGSAWFAHTRGMSLRQGVATALVGAAVALAWITTYQISEFAFEIVPVSSITFTGPSADTLMAFVGSRSMPLSFGLGLVPGVFVGAALAAIIAREWHIERFTAETPVERYIAGAVLMGFGAMLAGGCAVGSAMAGGSIFATTAWVAGMSIWAGGMSAAWVIERSAPLTGPSTA